MCRSVALCYSLNLINFEIDWNPNPFKLSHNWLTQFCLPTRESYVAILPMFFFLIIHYLLNLVLCIKKCTVYNNIFSSLTTKQFLVGLNPTEKTALVRQLVSSILAHTPSPNCNKRNHRSLLLVKKYPFLKGTFRAGHVCTLYLLVRPISPVRMQYHCILLP